MSITWQWILRLLLNLLSPIISQLTPIIKAELSEFLSGLYKKAAETSNPWDDMLIGMLMDMLGIPRPPPV